MRELENKAILVTGAGSGIGRASAVAIARAGGLLVLADINRAAVLETAALISGSETEVLILDGDIAAPTHCQALVDLAVKRFGRLDGAFNNAGIESPMARIADADEQDWDRSIAVNLKSVWLCLRAELRQMERQKYGAIVNTASVGGLIAVPNNACYAAAKHGVIGLTRTAAVEYVGSGIRVNAVCPGLTKSAMTQRLAEADPGLMQTIMPPMKRMAEPEEIAEVVVFLLSERASYLTGQAIAIDGAATAV